MKNNRSGCPLTSALDIVGDKWSLIIVRDLFMGKKTFTEFLNSPEKIATNILASRLEFLKNHGLIDVTRKANDKKTKIYYLTDKGIDMYPILYEMMFWSRRNLDKTFNDIGENWFLDVEGIPSTTVIKGSQVNYVKIREEIFSEQTS
jgi:DNA-binding HxlR family transcriptional regulator